MPQRTETLSPAEQRLKAASKKLVKAFGGQEAVHAATGYRQQRISDWGLPNVREFMPIDVVDLIEESTVGLPGWPHITRELAKRRGMLLVPAPEVFSDDEQLMRSIVEITGELGQLSTCIAQALHTDSEAGHIVTAREAQAALLKADDLQNCVAALGVKLRQIVERG